MRDAVVPRPPSLPEKNALLTSDPHLYECFKKIEEWAHSISIWAASLNITGAAPTSGAAPTPAVTAITPSSGATAGGTPVVITGTGFQFGATATVGGVSLTSAMATGPTTIVGTTGAHASGAVDVVVTNPDAQAGTLTGGYSYSSPAIPFVLTQTLGTLRNDFAAFLGFSFGTDANTPQVTALGRWKVAGSSQTHNLYLYKYVDGAGADVQIATVAVDLTSGSDGDYVYADLGSPVPLDAGTTYYVISEEFTTGDQWYNWTDTTADTFSPDIGTLSGGIDMEVLGLVEDFGLGGIYGPVNFKVQA